MRNFKIGIEYDGTEFLGWQVQKTGRTVQGEIQKAIKNIFKNDITLFAAGRTDTGVHAIGQVANFKVETNLPSEKILRALNANLPKDITIHAIEEVPLDFHSQFDAKEKVYQYKILNLPNRRSIGRYYFWRVREKLDLKKMKIAAKVFIGTHDFRAFGTKISQEKNCIRTISNVSIKKDGDYIVILIRGDGFIYNMVRKIVGTLVEVSRGKLTKSGVKNILLGKDRRLSGRTAPACGLTLLEVIY